MCRKPLEKIWLLNLHLKAKWGALEWKKIRVFDGKEEDIHNIIADIQGSVYDWVRDNAMLKGKSAQDFIVGWEDFLVWGCPLYGEGSRKCVNFLLIGVLAIVIFSFAVKFVPLIDEKIRWL